MGLKFHYIGGKPFIKIKDFESLMKLEGAEVS
jgi:hypothetical protein